MNSLPFFFALAFAFPLALLFPSLRFSPHFAFPRTVHVILSAAKNLSAGFEIHSFAMAQSG